MPSANPGSDDAGVTDRNDQLTDSMDFRRPLRINLIASVLVVVLGLFLAQPALSFYGFYPGSLAFPAQAALGAVAAMFGLSEKQRYKFLLLSSYLLLLLIAGWLVGAYAILGCNDGIGLRWVFLGGPTCLATYVIGIITLVMGIRQQWKLCQDAQKPKVFLHVMLVVLTPIALMAISHLIDVMRFQEYKKLHP